MPPRFSPEELAHIQRFQEEEGLWIDTVIRARAPRALTFLAERGDGSGFVARAAALVASRWTKLEKSHQRHTTTNMRTKGFRKANVSQTIEGITTTLFRHVRTCKEICDREGNRARPMCGAACIVASHRFDVGVSLRV